MTNHMYTKDIDVLKRKYIKDYDFATYLNTARDLISDTNYLKEHHRRTSKAKYDILIVPTLGGVISGFFLKDIFQSLIHNSCFDERHEDYVQEALEVFDIVKEVFSILDNFSWNGLKAEETGIGQQALSDFLTLENITTYLYRVDLLKHAGSFIGCSRGVSAIHNLINTYRNNTTKTDFIRVLKS